MKYISSNLLLVLTIMLNLNGISVAEDKTNPTSIAEVTNGMVHKPGLIDSYLDTTKGKIYLVLTRAKGSMGEYLYYEGLSSGLGSNPIGLDRSQIGNTRVLLFRSVGDRILLEEQNWRYRALTDKTEEKTATAKSFATSVLWATDVVAKGKDSQVLIDFTEFLLRDEHDVISRLKKAEQGNFSKDNERSFLDINACFAFPKNLEFGTTITYVSNNPGSEVRATTPDPRYLTLGFHHSLVELPDTGYTPRHFDPRIGAFEVAFYDYAAPLHQPIQKRWIIRHRLEKTDPSAKRSSVKKPIVYYVDRGAPEPIRSALLDGAGWWAEAFEAAGFIDAFRVELLPEGAHPLDLRYNVITWVHRQTRGWSYGWGVVDPRTGEMLKGHVVLGSLRVRQDRLLFEGLIGADLTGSGGTNDPIQLSLARIRQLAAHEVGHTLGVAHNFAASAYGRESVMDYPAPLVKVKDNSLDLSEVYGVGIGAWDKHTIRYAYSHFAPGTDESKALEAIVQDGIRAELHFLSDGDARPSGAANPLASLWDNGKIAEKHLEQMLEVRRIAMGNFSENRVALGRPMALLEEVYAPVYFMHRYAVDAAAKVLGGYEYNYGVRGDGQPMLKPLPRERQMKALEKLLDAMAPEVLDIPEQTLQILLPRPFGYRGNREMASGRTAPVFDPIAAAETAARMTASGIFQSARCARLIDQHRRDPSLPSYEEIILEVYRRVFKKTKEENRKIEVHRAVQRSVLDVMLDLANNPNAAPSLRGQTELALRQLQAILEKRKPDNFEALAHKDALLAKIERFFNRSISFAEPNPAPQPPPGSPIGTKRNSLGRGFVSVESNLDLSDVDFLFNLEECSWSHE